MKEYQNSKRHGRVWVLEFCILTLFRISDFDIRIYFGINAFMVRQRI